MIIVYDDHVRQRIAERKIEGVWIKETLKSPDLMRRFGNKYINTKKVNGHTLEIVYYKQKYIKIKTIYWV